MKLIQKLLVATALIVAVGLAGYAAEKQGANNERVLRVLSNGQVVAEVRLLAPGQFVCGGGLSVTKGGYATYSTKEPSLSGVLLLNDKKVVLRLSGNVEFAGQLEDLGLHRAPK